MSKYSLEDMAEIIDSEGLGYAIEDYVNSEDIEDPRLVDLWDQATVTLAAIRHLLSEVG